MPCCGLVENAHYAAGVSEQPTPPPGEAPPEPAGYEQARDELAAIVSRLETGGTTLEESLALWERAEELAALCQRWLDGARARLEQAMAEKSETPDGQDTDVS